MFELKYVLNFSADLFLFINSPSFIDESNKISLNDFSALSRDVDSLKNTFNS